MSPLRLSTLEPDLQEETLEPIYQKYVEQLISLVNKYQLPNTYIHSFVYDLTDQQYNDFLKHYTLRKKLTSHDRSALPYIIHKINVLTGAIKVAFIEEIVWAIDDYMYMITNKISYEELKTLRTPHYRPYDSEITKIVDGLETYHVDLNGQKIGSYERKNNEGIIIETGTYKDDLKHGVFNYQGKRSVQTGSYYKNKKIGQWLTYYENGILACSGWYHSGIPHGLWSFYDIEGQLIKEGSYVKGKKEGIWEIKDQKREYYLNGILLNYVS
jgi:hypothetical protein